MLYRSPVTDGFSDGMVHRIALTTPDSVDADVGRRAFIAGPENALVALLVDMLTGSQVDPPDRRTTMFPIVLHGPPGVGKTHLVQALIGAWKASSCRSGGLICRFAIDFAREFAEAVETGTLDTFHTRYREASLVILEDLEKIKEKTVAQEDLALTADVLQQRGGWLLVTSLQSPRELGLVPRLAARLVGGLDIPLAMPGVETRRNLILDIAAAQALELEDEVATELARGLELSAPGLAGALHRLRLLAKAQRQPIDLALAKQMVAGYNQERGPSAQDVLRAVAKRFSVRMTDLKGKSRRRSTVVARAAAMYMLRSLTPMTLNQIGSVLGGKDHRTVSHALRMTEQRIESDVGVRQAVEQLQQELLRL